MIPEFDFITLWLADTFVHGTAILIIAIAALASIKQPARRMPVAWGAFAGLLALAILPALSWWPRIALPVRQSTVLPVTFTQRHNSRHTVANLRRAASDGIDLARTDDALHVPGDTAILPLDVDGATDLEHERSIDVESIAMNSTLETNSATVEKLGDIHFAADNGRPLTLRSEPEKAAAESSCDSPSFHPWKATIDALPDLACTPPGPATRRFTLLEGASSQDVVELRLSWSRSGLPRAPGGRSGCFAGHTPPPAGCATTCAASSLRIAANPGRASARKSSSGTGLRHVRPGDSAAAILELRVKCTNRGRNAARHPRGSGPRIRPHRARRPVALSARTAAASRLFRPSPVLAGATMGSHRPGAAGRCSRCRRSPRRIRRSAAGMGQIFPRGTRHWFLGGTAALELTLSSQEEN